MALLIAPCGALAQTGPCCDLTSGFCTITTPQACNGQFMSGTTCSPNPCTLSCCLPDGSCVMLTPAACTASNGLRGNISPGGNFLCHTNACVHACCMPNGSCSMLTLQNCQQLVGSPHVGSVCAGVSCTAGLGACCDRFGVCQTLVFTACNDGRTFQQGSCSPSPCPVTCCLPSGACSMISPTQCATAGGAVGGVTVSGYVCLPTSCPTACCAANGTCTMTISTACTGVTHPATSCSPLPCAIACCAPLIGCTIRTTASCASIGGEALPSSTCTPSICRGACCSSTSPGCAFLSSADCIALGQRFEGSGTSCSPSPCVSRGACCLGGRCVVTQENDCTGRFLGHGSSCVPPVIDGGINPCCPADFNGRDGLTLQDLFDYLNAWFAGC